MSGPLHGIRIIEFGAMGPVPLAGQLLADLGAEIICIDRIAACPNPDDVNRRGKHSIAIDLKSPAGLEIAKRFLGSADALMEGYRPGVMERLGLGPAELGEQLIYARMTGWGQYGRQAQTAGHDLNYLALTGALHALGKADQPPSSPLNLIADSGGGALFLVMGILAAIIERQRSGKGQVIDAAMVDGVPAMMGLIFTMMANGDWVEQRERNLLDGGAPFYRCYECADGKYIAIGAIEPQFFADMVRLAGLPAHEVGRQNDRAQWPAMHAAYEAHFLTRNRDEWSHIFDGSDACVTPVLTVVEAAKHAHNVERGVFITQGHVRQAAPAPRFSRTQAEVGATPTITRKDAAALLSSIGIFREEFEELMALNIVS